MNELRVWNVSGIILMGGWSTWRRTCSMVTFSATDSTRIGQDWTWASMV